MLPDFACGGDTVEDSHTYEIFKKELDNTTELVETVKGIKEAHRVVQKLKQEASNDFYIFDPVSDRVIDPLRPSIAIDPFAP